ncbi:hypothetical protein NDU88_003497 [Pleurodeles waltl]|uniref:Uncharacterized protein n=1 Tax=Pleurodeles waltl TaxID=8319 RepID=A0AAV7NIC6_PLEWA|nr:hypothetical protein NDU88_003497 [Pleurodeles waltl]
MASFPGAIPARRVAPDPRPRGIASFLGAPGSQNHRVRPCHTLRIPDNTGTSYTLPHPFRDGDYHQLDLISPSNHHYIYPP